MTKEVTSVVRMRHIRSANLCASGARSWFRENNLDWNDFLTNGIASQILLDTGDPMARKAVDVAERENEQ